MVRFVACSLRSSLQLAAALSALALPGLAQGFNVDFSNFNGPPSTGYVAAGTQSGVWNNVTTNSQVPLVDLTGAPSPVTLTAPTGSMFFGWDNLNTTGDDELLLDAGIDGAVQITLSGLGNGPYVVYTYAFAPDNRLLYFTDVGVQGAVEPVQTVGGADWSGTHIQGVTYAKHTVQVTNGTITIDCTINQSFCTINGLQVEPTGPICFAPSTYCTAKVNSLGCTPVVAFVGTPKIGATSGYVVLAYNVRNNKNGLLFYGTTGRAAVPFQGGTLCVGSPIRRTPSVSSGGAPAPANNCSGVFALDMNTFASGQFGGTPSPLLNVVGTVVDCQWWGRDPGFPAPNNITLSDAVEYVICL